ncbi:MAG: cupin domain-containing protein [Acidobacteriota bacterium]
MRLNADFSRRAVLRPGESDWLSSPESGVDRLMLDRIGDEVARATSLVRYAPGSRFSAHTHSGGEEYLVLEGTFSDESGDYPQGSYVHNPVGSEHTPRSEDGCVIFVKLHWMQPGDQKTVRLATSSTEEGWQSCGEAEWLLLHEYGAERSELLRLEAGSQAEWAPSGGGEVLVLSGDMTSRFQGRTEALSRNDWLRLPIGVGVELSTETGCRLFCKQGHLAAPPPLPSP